jgi:hypothetical protein
MRSVCSRTARLAASDSTPPVTRPAQTCGSTHALPPVCSFTITILWLIRLQHGWFAWLMISTIVRFLTSSRPHESNTVTTTILHPRRRWLHPRGAKLTPRLDSSHCFAPSEFLDSSRMTHAAHVDDTRGCSRCLARLGVPLFVTLTRAESAALQTSAVFLSALSPLRTRIPIWSQQRRAWSRGFSCKR